MAALGLPQWSLGLGSLAESAPAGQSSCQKHLQPVWMASAPQWRCSVVQRRGQPTELHRSEQWEGLLRSGQSWAGQGCRRRRPSQMPVCAAGQSGGPAHYDVLITGSTKGIGLALAQQFLSAGDRVLICSRSEDGVKRTVSELGGEFGQDRVVGTTCDVSKAADVDALVAFAKENLGQVDLWINNAGSNAYSFKPLVESDDSDITEVVSTNTLGVMLCCRAAIRLMRQQPRGGHIFNMDGAGADGNATPRFAAYGATKRSLAQFTKSVQAELQQLEIRNVVLHNLSPGMVTTELLMAGADRRQARFFINALAERPEDVAAYLVPRVRAVPQTSSGKSTYIRFLTSTKAYSQILARLLFKARKDRYVPED